ncbi:MAG: histidine--tRNA ligase [Bacillota bacterium]
MQAKRPRGTADVLPPEVERWHHVEGVIRKLCQQYNYGEIRIPEFEHTELFLRIGEATDIVQKEMYTFQDRAGRSLTLRPEGTVGVARSFIENKLYGGILPAKFYYLGPMFRYERPQAGRGRQFTQFGVELFGAAGPWADAETILLALDLFARLGLSNLRVLLNSIGCPGCRPRYRQALLEYYRNLSGDVCPACRERMERNPLRLLDCKEPGCRSLVASAPRATSYLCGQCHEHFQGVQEFLAAAGASLTVEPALVRGLDYYTRTVYEVISEDLGAQNTVCGGGRYDGLVEALTGPPTPAVGFALGMERLLMVLQSQGRVTTAGRPLDVFVVAAGEEGRKQAPLLSQRLRRTGLATDADFLDRSVKAQMKHAGRAGARLVLVVGDEELARGKVLVKEMASGQQWSLDLGDLEAGIERALGGEEGQE